MMHGPIGGEPVAAAVATNRFVAAADRALAFVNRIIVIVSSVAMVLACVILSYSVVTRSLFHSPTYWQDEASVFLIVGVTFMTCAFVQQHRGHIGIEAFVGLLSPRANWVRELLIDVANLAFCSFFAWKSWTLTHEAYVDGQVTNSIWSPPLAIPYSLMAAGMTLLCVQILLQLLGSFGRAPRK
ncbi:MAG: TRAP transporter small permease [Afipia sp.]|nr:TRAP transporter small permease [Afipia sp.]OJW63941.1 MAG: TRAP transporter small permease protein [Afipia sp. 64-13]